MGGCQRNRDPDVGAPRSLDPGRTTRVNVQPRTRDRGCAGRRGRGSLTIRGSWRRRRPARSLPVGSAPPPVPRWWPLRPRGPARDAQAQMFTTGTLQRCFSELEVSLLSTSHPCCASVNPGARAKSPRPIIAAHCVLGLVVLSLHALGLDGLTRELDSIQGLEIQFRAKVDTFHVC